MACIAGAGWQKRAGVCAPCRNPENDWSLFHQSLKGSTIACHVASMPVAITFFGSCLPLLVPQQLLAAFSWLLPLPSAAGAAGCVCWPPLPMVTLVCSLVALVPFVPVPPSGGGCSAFNFSVRAGKRARAGSGQPRLAKCAGAGV